MTAGGLAATLLKTRRCGYNPHRFSFGEIIMSARSVSRIALILLVFGAMLVSACNTVSGVGRDAQAAGRAVTGAAEDAKH